MLTTMRLGATVAGLMTLFGCTSGSAGPTEPATDEGGVDARVADSRSEGGEASASGAAACVAAGGQCVQGVSFCANVGPGATPQSCLDVGPAMLCCAVSADAGCTEIQAPSYDQTCTIDSDCITVAVGNACEECVFACRANVGAINIGAMAQYTADVDKTPAGAAACGCPLELVSPPCCRGGQCHADNECLPLDGSIDSGDGSADAAVDSAGPAACAAAGGACVIGPSANNCASGNIGPQDCNPDRNPGGAFCCLPGDASAP